MTAWTVDDEYSDGSVSNQNIVFRNFTETRDSVGPVLEGLEDSSGALVSTPTIAVPGTIETPTNTVVLTFDEDMMTTGLDSVTSGPTMRPWTTGPWFRAEFRKLISG